MKKQQIKQPGRRKFLRDGAAVSAGAAIVASSPASALNMTEQGQTDDKPRGYRVTKHIAAYYRTAAE